MGEEMKFSKEKSILHRQIQALEGQVKNLMAGELTQYRLQLRLDVQLKSQAELIKLSQNLQNVKNCREIGMLVSETLVESLDYEKAVVLVFEPHKNKYAIAGMDGYYQYDEEKMLKKEVSKIVDAYHFDSLKRIRVQSGSSQPLLGMDTRVIIPCFSRKKEILALIQFGNTDKRKDFFRRIDMVDDFLWETIAGMTSSAFENVMIYSELASERESLKNARDNLKKLNEKLEAMVFERTRELAESEDRLKDLYMESMRTSKLYRSLLDASPDPIVVYDIKGIPTYINPAFTEVFGWKFEELAGKRIDFTPPQSMKETKAMIEMVIRGENISNKEIKRYTKNGEILDVSLSAATFTDDTGKTAGSVVNLRNITEKKRMEEELLKVRKLESVGLLAGGLAHDFNNTLSGIMMNAQVARIKQKKGKAVEKYLKGIENAVEEAVALTKQLLTFAKGGEPVMKVLSIGELIKSWTDFVIRGSNAKCNFRIGKDLLPVEVDEGQLSQVVHNLIINAIHAMPDGGNIDVEVRNLEISHDAKLKSHVTFKEGDYVEILIKDQGIGISLSNLPKIFDPYFTTKEKGSGLGLATTYSIIKKHRGYIYVQSEQGAGSEFYIYLPAVKKTLLKNEHKALKKRLVSGRGRILIMDDEALIREIGVEMLKTLGYEAVSVSEGKEVLHLIKMAKKAGNPFDVIIMDLTVPGGMGGKQTIERLRSIDSEIKVIVSSGYSNDPIMSDFLRYGFNGVMVKPYKIEDMNVLLNNLIQKKSSDK